MPFEQELACAEALELHEFLDEKGVPRTKVSSDGQLEDDRGKYYILPLIDRVEYYANTLASSAVMDSSVANKVMSFKF